jgi:FtsH-binding integral membrane protein
MIADIAGRPEGAYVLALLLAVAVGLVMSHRTARATVSVVLVSAVFVVGASTRVEDAPFAAPLYVVVAAVTSIVVAAVQLADSPLLVGEPWWRKFLLVMVHEGSVRRAAQVQSRAVPDVPRG